MEEFANKISRLKRGLLFIALFLLSAHTANAATLYLSPTPGTLKVNSTFNVGVFVSSIEQSMNAAQATVSFPADKLQVTAVTKADSIIKFWLQEPVYSNSAGNVKLEGILFNPGYQGNAGRLTTITFKVKSEGSGTVSLTAGSVLANDGVGTNILTGLGSIKFTAGAGTVTPEPPKPPTEPKIPTLTAPVIASTTHADPEAWYANNNPLFQWLLPSGVTGVSYYVSQSPDSVPSPRSDGLLKEYSVTDAPEGTSYFHLRFGNAGGFGPTSHTRFNVDTAPPTSFEITRTDEVGSLSTVAHFSLDASDATSGIAEYRIMIDDEFEIKVPGDLHEFATPELTPGDHVITATVADKAGNTLSNSVEFSILAPEPPAPETTPEESLLAAIGKLFMKHKISLSIIFFLILVNLIISLWSLIRRFYYAFICKKDPAKSRTRKKKE